MVTLLIVMGALLGAQVGSLNCWGAFLLVSLIMFPFAFVFAYGIYLKFLGQDMHIKRLRNG
jgi:hypothetical protein